MDRLLAMDLLEMDANPNCTLFLKICAERDDLDDLYKILQEYLPVSNEINTSEFTRGDLLKGEVFKSLNFKFWQQNKT